MIQNKKKICKECGKEDYIWSKGRCKQCSIKSYIKKGQLSQKGKIINRFIHNNDKKTKDMQYYKEKWDSMPVHGIQKTRKCEECNKELKEFNPSFISHIVSKGANTALRYDLRNSRLYCFSCHYKWEFGDRKAMSTFQENQQIKVSLIREYYLVGEDDNS